MADVMSALAASSLQAGDPARVEVEAAPSRKAPGAPAKTQGARAPAKATGKKAAGKKAAAKRKPKPSALAESASDSDSDADAPSGCPASKKDDQFDKELKKLKKMMGSKQAPQKEAFNPWLSTEMSEAERQTKKEMFLSFYREQYAALKAKTAEVTKPALDLEQYDDQATQSLTITKGHRPMARPKAVRLPKDFKKPLGTLTLKQLEEKGSASCRRKLVCIHGDIFDVSDRPDKYGEDGPYAYMSGHDLTWGFVGGNDAEEELDKFYDVFKIIPEEKADRKLQGLMSWWAFFEKEYGAPVGRLDVYDKEWTLPPPPAEGLEDACCVM